MFGVCFNFLGHFPRHFMRKLFCADKIFSPLRDAFHSIQITRANIILLVVLYFSRTPNAFASKKLNYRTRRELQPEFVLLLPLYYKIEPCHEYAERDGFFLLFMPLLKQKMLHTYRTHMQVLYTLSQLH